MLLACGIRHLRGLRSFSRLAPMRGYPADRQVVLSAATPSNERSDRRSGRWRRKVTTEDVDMEKEAPCAVPPTVDESVRPDPKRLHTAAANGSVRSVCVIGGGPSGLGCCKVLCDAGLDVTLVQESRGLGGKLCTKYVNGKDDPTLHFDMGVQLLKPAGPLRDALLAGDVVAPWPRPDRFKRIQCKGDWKRWSVVQESSIPTDDYVVGVPSMSTIGHYLADQCKGLQIHVDRTAHVTGRLPRKNQWLVEWARGEPTQGQLQYRPELKDVPNESGRGEFDAVVLAFEANKIVRGCKSGYKMTQPSATPHIQRQVKPARTCQLWNLMVAFDSELAMPWDAAVVDGHPALAWIAVDSSKPQRAKTPQCFMAFSTVAWANWKQWGKREVEHALLDEFMQFLGEVLGRRPPKPCFVLAGRWGNSTDTVLTNDAPRGEFPMRATTFHAGTAGVVWDGASNMGATGDWTRGFSASDAYAAGHELAKAITTQ